MKCLEDYTIGRIKEMSREEIKWLWNEIVEEKQEMDMRHTIINMVDIANVNESVIES